MNIINLCKVSTAVNKNLQSSSTRRFMGREPVLKMVIFIEVTHICIYGHTNSYCIKLFCIKTNYNIELGYIVE